MNPDDLGRTLKLEMDDGRAESEEDARRIVATYRLGIRIGRGFEANRTATAAALTAINTAVRAFPGGVDVEAQADAVISHGWGGERPLHAIVESMGARNVVQLRDDLGHVISIGESSRTARPGQPRTLFATWEGWGGGVVLDRSDCGSEDADQPLAGVLAGALGVSEAFQATRGFGPAARRDVGVSLWRPDLPWRDPAARGPAIEILPEKIWLLGLGHLGQAHAWSIGSLPYPPGALLIGLLDPQVVVAANVDTGLLTALKDIGRPKARVVAAALERRGVATIVTERLFDGDFRPQRPEPSTAFAGFDSPEPRRILEGAGFSRVVDAGLGGGAQHYLDILIHSFPSELRAVTAFPERTRTDPASLLDRPAYAAAIDRLLAGGMTHADARCGVLEVAGRTVGAAFVGAVASTFVVAEELRALIDGPRFEVISVSLRSPEYLDAVVNPAPGPWVNPGFVRAFVSGARGK
jgi:hypothetical protein